jgi:putative SOS response-associated peptidase YedK
MGHALAGLRAEGSQQRSGRDERSQHGLAALAPVAGRRKPLCRAVYQFSENEALPDGRKPPIWSALAEERPLACFAGIWTNWTSVRKVKEGETTNDVFAFLTTEPNALVGTYHPKTMPAILRSQDEIDMWMEAPGPVALQPQRPLPDDALMIVARGSKQDP